MVADQKNSEAYEFIEEISEKRLDLSYQIFVFDERSRKCANGGFADAERRHFWNRLDGDRDGTKAAWLKIQWVI